MNYIAVKSKVLAMSARLLNSGDYQNLVCCTSNESLSAALGKQENPSLFDECERVSSFIYAKPVRDYVRGMTYGLTGAGASPPRDTASNRRTSPSESIRHWSYVMWRRLGMLDKPSRDALKRGLGTEMDLRNILWIYRLKQYHNIEGSAVFGYLMPAVHRLSDITRLVECKDGFGLIEALADSPYGEIFRDITDLRLGEQALAKAVRAKFRAESRSANAACICGYLYEKHLEIRNIRAITEGIKFGFAPEEILKRLY